MYRCTCLPWDLKARACAGKRSLQPSLERLVDQAASLSLTVADITNAAATDPATQAVVEAGDKATKNGGFFGPIAGLFEGILKVQCRLWSHSQMSRP